MSREIKFRAWHIGFQKMFSAEEMANDQLTLLPTGKFINVNGTSAMLSEVIDDMIPLQYTELKDKNGVEIYEGDIVTANTKDGIKWPCQGIVEYLPDVCYFGINVGKTNPGEEESYYAHFWTHTDFEVIGNIYEKDHTQPNEISK